MADVTYRVVIDLETRGQLPGQDDRSVSKLGGLDQAITKVASNAASMAGSLAGAFEHAVEKAAALTWHVAKLGALGAFGAITFGVLGFNQEMEKARIGLAAIFGANNVTKNMTERMSLAANVM